MWGFFSGNSDCKFPVVLTKTGNQGLETGNFLINLALQQHPMVIHKSFADFVLFLYIHMAHADSDFHRTELSIIRKKMGKLYPYDDKLEERLDAALKEYEAFDKKQLKILFKDTFNHFPHIKFAQKYKVYSDMYEIVNADGKIEESEAKALQELKEIIDISAEVSHHK